MYCYYTDVLQQRIEARIEKEAILVFWWNARAYQTSHVWSPRNRTHYVLYLILCFTGVWLPYLFISFALCLYFRGYNSLIWDYHELEMPIPSGFCILSYNFSDSYIHPSLDVVLHPFMYKRKLKVVKDFFKPFSSLHVCTTKCFLPHGSLLLIKIQNTLSAQICSELF
jgi:hypothetical protein